MSHETCFLGFKRQVLKARSEREGTAVLDRACLDHLLKAHGYARPSVVKTKPGSPRPDSLLDAQRFVSYIDSLRKGVLTHIPYVAGLNRGEKRYPPLHFPHSTGRS